MTALGNITSADGAATWAQEVLAAKNRLVGTDAKLLAWISTDRNWANADGLGAIGRGAGIGLATTGL